MKTIHTILTPNQGLQLVDKGGMLTPNGIQLLQQVTKAVRGETPQINCTATNAGNVYSLTPFNNTPEVFTTGDYSDFLSFAFVSPFTSTGAVTATIIPDTGSLATIPVYVNHGATQAAAGDIVINRFYIINYVSTLNSGNGGFVIL